MINQIGFDRINGHSHTGHSAITIIMMYKDLAKIPVPTTADLVLNTCRGQFLPTLLPRKSSNVGIWPWLDHPSLATIQIFYSVADFTKNVKRQMSKYLTIPLPSETSAIPPTSVPTHLEDTSGTILQRNSPSRKKRAILRKISNGKGDSSVSRIVEIWEDGQLEVSLNVTDLHGDFYADGKSFCKSNK